MDSKKDIFSTGEGKQDFIIALIVIAIFSAVIYHFVFNAADEVADSKTIESVQPIADKESQQNFHYTSSSTNSATSIQVVDGYESELSSAVVVSDIKKSTSIKNKGNSKPIYSNNETILLYEAQKKRTDSIAEAKKEGGQAKTSLQDNLKETSIVEAPKEIKNTTPTIANTTLNCVVIVGVFKEAGNKAKVITKLKALGHTHSEGILRENLSYVGVPVNCENERTRENLLSELNEAFGIDSWVKKL